MKIKLLAVFLLVFLACSEEPKTPEPEIPSPWSCDSLDISKSSYYFDIESITTPAPDTLIVWDVILDYPYDYCPLTGAGIWWYDSNGNFLYHNYATLEWEAIPGGLYHTSYYIIISGGPDPSRRIFPGDTITSVLDITFLGRWSADYDCRDLNNYFITNCRPSDVFIVPDSIVIP